MSKDSKMTNAFAVEEAALEYNKAKAAAIAVIDIDHPKHVRRLEAAQGVYNKAKQKLEDAIGSGVRIQPEIDVRGLIGIHGA